MFNEPALLVLTVRVKYPMQTDRQQRRTLHSVVEEIGDVWCDFQVTVVDAEVDVSTRYFTRRLSNA
jgi:hypothetical protein